VSTALFVASMAMNSQITSDGLAAYVDAIDQPFAVDVEFRAAYQELCCDPRE
jgi:hypothetical protein